MKKIILLLLSISLATTNIYATDIHLEMDMVSPPQFLDFESVPPPIDMPMQTALDTANIGAGLMVDAAQEMAFDLQDASDIINNAITDENLFDDLVVDTVSDLDSQNDLTEQMLSDLAANPQQQVEQIQGEIIDVDADGDLSKADSPVQNLTDEDGDDEKEKKDADNIPDEQDEDQNPPPPSAFFNIDIFFPQVYADEQVEDDTSSIKTNENNMEATKTSSTNKTFYLRTSSQSYIIETNDEYIEYFMELISNKGITVEVSAEQLTNFRIEVLHISVLEEISELIWKKYNDFCTDKLKDLLPTGVFFTKNNSYYFTDTSTNELAMVKTDDYLLQILIPLIADTGIETSIYHENIKEGMVYISEIILQEDLPDDIAKEYKKQYKDYLQNNLFNIVGNVIINNNNFYLQTDIDMYKIITDDKQIASSLISLVNYIVKAHGYIDPDNMTINVVKIEY